MMCLEERINTYILAKHRSAIEISTKTKTDGGYVCITIPDSILMDTIVNIVFTKTPCRKL